MTYITIRREYNAYVAWKRKESMQLIINQLLAYLAGPKSLNILHRANFKRWNTYYYTVDVVDIEITTHACIV